MKLKKSKRTISYEKELSGTEQAMLEIIELMEAYDIEDIESDVLYNRLQTKYGYDKSLSLIHAILHNVRLYKRLGGR